MLGDSTDWRKIIFSNHESKDLDYKAPAPWNSQDKASCCEIVKDILAMANSGGGRIVIGVSESDGQYDYKGVSIEDLKSFDTTTLNVFINKYSDPPINIKIFKPSIDNKSYVVLQVDGFADTPHFCIKDFPQVLNRAYVYVRTDNNESAPLQNSADFRRIVERAVRNKGDVLLDTFRSVLVNGREQVAPSDLDSFHLQISSARAQFNDLFPYKKVRLGVREVSFFPAQYCESRFRLEELYEMAFRASVEFRGWGFLFASPHRRDLIHAIQDGIESEVKKEADIPSFSEYEYQFWQLRQSGLLYTCELLREDASSSASRDANQLWFDNVAAMSYEAIFSLLRLYEERIPESEPCTMIFNLNNMMNRVLTVGDKSHYRMLPSPSCKLDAIQYKSTNTLGDWRAGLVEHALELTRYIFERMNWADPSMNVCKKIIEELHSSKSN